MSNRNLRIVVAVVITTLIGYATTSWIQKIQNDNARRKAVQGKMEEELVYAKSITANPCNTRVVWVVTSPKGFDFHPLIVIAGVEVTSENRSWFEFVPSKDGDISVYYNKPESPRHLLTVKNDVNLCQRATVKGGVDD
jgi:hypothetical protein